MKNEAIPKTQRDTWLMEVTGRTADFYTSSK
jgi:hypothetical protein